VPRLVQRYLHLGHPEAKLIDRLTFAAVREDLDFHSLQVLEAGFTQADRMAAGQRRARTALHSNLPTLGRSLPDTTQFKPVGGGRPAPAERGRSLRGVSLRNLVVVTAPGPKSTTAIIGHQADFGACQ
jgi:hypothetical protein